MPSKATSGQSPRRYFYDTYAVISFVSGDRAFARYFEECTGVLTKLNLLELCYISLQRSRQTDLRVASEIVWEFAKYVIDFSHEDTIGAMTVRRGLKGRGLDVSCGRPRLLSARKLRIRFLTGDAAFR